jgi:hypothetical protein
VAGDASCCSRSLGPLLPLLLSSSFVSISFVAPSVWGVTLLNKKQEANNAINNIDKNLFIFFFLIYIISESYISCIPILVTNACVEQYTIKPNITR